MMTLVHSADPITHGGYVVRTPRSTDAIGHALRGAYRGGIALPIEMATLLRRLDRTN